MDYLSLMRDFFSHSISLLLLGIVVYLVTKFLNVHLKGFDFFDKPKITALWAMIAVSIGMSLITWIMFLASSHQDSSIESVQRTTQMYSLNNIVSIMILWILIISPILIVMRIRKESWKSVGISKHNLIPGVIVGISVSFCAFFVMLVASFIKNGSIIIDFNKYYFGGFIYFSIVGLGEEFMFRGYLQTRLMAWLGYKGWLLTSIIMAIIHIPQRMAVQGLSISEAIFNSLSLIPISLIMGYIYNKTENLVAPSIYHTFANWLGLLFCA